MSRKAKDKGRIGGPFVPLLIHTIDTPAWRIMSHGAKALYIALRRRYSPNTHNNGRIFLSTRDAANEINSHRDRITRWFRELQHCGFIVMTNPGCLGVDGKGKAPHWRLTELGSYVGGILEPPTRDFLRWNGEPFEDQKNRIPSLKTGTLRPLKRGHPRPLFKGH